MPTDCISYQDSGYFTKVIIDYLDEKPQLKQLYNRFPNIENFKLQIEEKQDNFPDENRQIIASELEKQYVNVDASLSTLNNIKLLKKSTTFTITTGHQLNLFTGPLYFLYKIVSTINLCKELKIKYPENDFVPIYWMATEDHDFEEINYFNFKNKKIKWNKESSGPVGRYSTIGLENVFTAFSSEIGVGENANYLKKKFQKSYLENDNLAKATQFLANELFKNEGLVILDGDAIALKKLFIPYAKEELTNQTSFKKVNETNTHLKEY
uniref:bacillithiol biosynthesis protein BshC n=1 Tax=Flavobacterium sp. TaxID=239 RepID=UPI003751D97E